MAVGTPAPLLPEDKRGNSIQVLSPDETSVTSTTIAAGNQRIALPAGSQVVEVAVQDSCRVAFGDSNVDATAGTRRLMMAGLYVYKVPYTAPGVLATHIAFTQVAGSTGVATVAKLV